MRDSTEGKDSSHLLGSYYALSTPLNSLYTTLWDDDYNPHFIDEETEFKLPQITKLVRT